MVRTSLRRSLRALNGTCCVTTAPGRVEVWDGQRWYATSSNWIGEAELLGLMEWLRANLWLNYLERGSGNAFRSIGEFTRYGGLERTLGFSSAQHSPQHNAATWQQLTAEGLLHSEWALLSCNELVKKYGIDQDLVWRNWIPISRVIYDQDLKINCTFPGTHAHTHALCLRLALCRSVCRNGGPPLGLYDLVHC